jgi:hypothetical protein
MLLCSEAGTGGAGIFLLEKVFKSKVSMHDVSILSTAFACNKALYRGRGIRLRIGIDSINGLMRTSISYNWTQGVWRRKTFREYFQIGLDTANAPLTTAQRNLQPDHGFPSY